MDVDGSLSVVVCGEDAEAQFAEEGISAVCIGVFEFQNPVLYFFLQATVFEVLDLCQEVVHTVVTSSQR